MPIKYISQAGNLKNKTILLRTDLDFDLKSKFADYKIKQLLQTINYCKKAEKLIIISSKGAYRSRKDSNYSLKDFVKPLEKALRTTIKFLDVKPSKRLTMLVKASAKTKVFLLENLNFYEEEQNNSKIFAKQLAKLADIYVNDSFSKMDQKSASIVSLVEVLPSYAGLQIKQELKNLEKIVKTSKPAVLVLGGSNILERIKFLKEHTKRFNYILLGGVLANTFLTARLYKIGASDIEDSKLIVVNKIFNQYKRKIKLPVDFVVGEKKNIRTGVTVVQADEKNFICKRPEAILDIGPKTIASYAEIIKKAQTIFYSGSMGVYEYKRSEYGSKVISRLIASRASGRAFGMATSDNTLNLLEQVKMLKFMDFSSLGNDVTMKYIRGEKLAGLISLNK